MERNKKRLPGIGQRIFKSAAVVFCCFAFYYYFRQDGIILYSQLAALWCVQPLRENTISNAFQRTEGTVIGAVFGLAAMLLYKYLLLPLGIGYLGYVVMVSLMIIAVLYLTLIMHRKNSSYFCCVVFLGVIVGDLATESPYLFVWNRFLDTMIGLVIGMIVNEIRLPRRRENEVLFISEMDDTLLAFNQQLSDYSQVELNRMLEEGLQFTVCTIRTPAALMEPLRGINLKLPVIVMDGAAMYDIHTYKYLYAYVISKDTAKKIREYLDSLQANYFIHMLIDNILIIQYKELKNEAEKDIYQRLGNSPYRNYTDKEIFPDMECVYFMLIEKKERAQEIYQELQKLEELPLLRMTCYESSMYPGYMYIKIFNKNATMENMIQYLKKETGMEKTVTFGGVEGKYDIVIDGYNNNKVVKTLKKMYRPLIWKKRKF